MWFFFFSSRRRHTRWPRDWSSDVCSSDLGRLLDRQGVVLAHHHNLDHLARFVIGHSDGAHFKHFGRSEERRVGKECRSGWAPDDGRKEREGRGAVVWGTDVVRYVEVEGST